jgi:hypothetical protein
MWIKVEPVHPTRSGGHCPRPCLERRPAAAIAIDRANGLDNLPPAHPQVMPSVPHPGPRAIQEAADIRVDLAPSNSTGAADVALLLLQKSQEARAEQQAAKKKDIFDSSPSIAGSNDQSKTKPGDDQDKKL